MTYQVLFLASPLLLVAIAQGLCMKYDWFFWLKRPLDFGLTFRSKKIFGAHKTWRGLLINVIFCMVGTLIQKWLQNHGLIPSWVLLVDYSKDGHILGLLLGLGMTAGELPNSFLKRQLDIAPGKHAKGLLRAAFFLLDQVDLAIGIWVFIFCLVEPSFSLVLWSLALALVLHVMVSSVGYLLGMRKSLV